MFIDKYLETASSLNYYWFSLGPVALGISTYHPLTEGEIDLFKRFLKVFELAYQRYLDIEKAEAQAREAQIEVSLERVRSRSMAMHHTSELQDVINTVHQQFKALNIAVTGGAFVAINEDNARELTIWGAGGVTDYAERVHFPFLDRPIYTGLIAGMNNGPGLFTEEFSHEEKIEFFNHLFQHPPFSNASPERKAELLSRPGGYTRSCCVSEYTTVFVINHHGERFSEEENRVLVRFGNVFEQSYTRFLDLQKAEAQARESQIELALERVRARTMAMQKSEELQEVIQVVYDQFVQLGIGVEHTGFILDYRDRDDMHIWLADRHKVPSEITIPYFDSPHWNSFLDAKEKGLDFFANQLSFEEKNRFYQDLFKLFFVPDDAQEYYFSCPGLAISTVLLENVGLYIENFSGIPYTDEENTTLMRFGKVFQQTYTRFNDLKRAEAQAREARIEAALERVRSKAMAMYSTTDLSTTVSTFFKELRSLNVLPWRCGVGQIDEETKTTFLTTTSNTINGESSEVRGALHQEGHPVLDGIFEHWKLQKEFYPVLQGDDIRRYYEIIRPQIAYPQYPLDAIQYGHFIFIREGFVFAWTENKLSEGELEIFRRFASVLSLTYRRYLDLKEAEEQNRIIQADNERKTRELEEARHMLLSMLPKELPRLPHLDIAVYMKTSSEVGGDYYDFGVDDDGTLTVAMGDATGHGMKAGTIVSMIKTLFASGGARMDMKAFFTQSSDTLKGIELGRLMMAFTMLKMRADKVEFANAGMPPLFVYREGSKVVEEVMIPGMPLGAMKRFPYDTHELGMSAGDAILLLSDGLPELKTTTNEQYGYERVKQEFLISAERSPSEIVEYLKHSASEWSSGTEPDDDMTFVVIKAK